MNDPDGIVQTIREQEKHIADLELRLKLRDKRILWWQGMASDLYDELICFYDPTGATGIPDMSCEEITSVINRFEEAVKYEPQ
jgi:hypothetical protein